MNMRGGGGKGGNEVSTGQREPANMHSWLFIPLQPAEADGGAFEHLLKTNADGFTHPLLYLNRANNVFWLVLLTRTAQWSSCGINSISNANVKLLILTSNTCRLWDVPFIFIVGVVVSLTLIHSRRGFQSCQHELVTAYFET